MINVPLNAKDMLRRDLSLKSHPKDEVIFAGDRQFCFSFLSDGDTCAQCHSY